MTSLGAGGSGGVRIGQVDAARGAAVLLVVLYHVSMPFTSHLPAWLNSMNVAVGGIRMPLLLFIGGMLAQRAWQDPTRARQRAFDLGWIYVIWTLIGVLAAEWNIAQLLVPTGFLWFLWLLATAFATLPLVRHIAPALVLAACLALSLYSEIRPPSIIEPHIPRHVIFFYLGLYAGPRLLLEARQSPIFISCAALFFAAAIHFVDAVAAEHIGFRAFLTIERVALLTASLSGCLVLPLLVVRFFAWFGQKSLAIYVGHVIMLAPLQSVLPNASALSRVLVATSIGVGASLAIYFIARPVGLGVLYQRPSGIAKAWRGIADERLLVPTQRVAEAQPSPHPEGNGCVERHAREGVGCALVVAGGNAAKVLDAAEDVFNQMAAAASVLVAADGSLVGASIADDRDGASIE